MRTAPGKLSIALGLAVTILFARAAAADWQYTRWGMTEAEVIEASAGKAVAHFVAVRESWGIYADLVAPTRFGTFAYDAYFYFDDETQRLKAVRLEPAAPVWCIDVMKALMVRYGSDQRLINGKTVWRDPSNNNRITLSGFSTCRVKYQPLAGTDR